LVIFLPEHLLHCAVGGRREPVTLGKVLKFVTGREFEPVLGYDLQPTIEFDENVRMPHANTCISQLRLPLHADAYNFNLFDLAFVNDYFGIM